MSLTVKGPFLAQRDSTNPRVVVGVASQQGGDEFTSQVPQLMAICDMLHDGRFINRARWLREEEPKLRSQIWENAREKELAELDDINASRIGYVRSDSAGVVIGRVFYVCSMVRAGVYSAVHAATNEPCQLISSSIHLHNGIEYHTTVKEFAGSFVVREIRGMYPAAWNVAQAEIYRGDEVPYIRNPYQRHDAGNRFAVIKDARRQFVQRDATRFVSSKSEPLPVERMPLLTTWKGFGFDAIVFDPRFALDLQSSDEQLVRVWRNALQQCAASGTLVAAKQAGISWLVTKNEAQCARMVELIGKLRQVDNTRDAFGAATILLLPNIEAAVQDTIKSIRQGRDLVAIDVRHDATTMFMDGLRASCVTAAKTEPHSHRLCKVMVYCAAESTMTTTMGGDGDGGSQPATDNDVHDVVVVLTGCERATMASTIQALEKCITTNATTGAAPIIALVLVFDTSLISPRRFYYTSLVCGNIPLAFHYHVSMSASSFSLGAASPTSRQYPRIKPLPSKCATTSSTTCIFHHVPAATHINDEEDIVEKMVRWIPFSSSFFIVIRHPADVARMEATVSRAFETKQRRGGLGSLHVHEPRLMLRRDKALGLDAGSVYVATYRAVTNNEDGEPRDRNKAPERGRPYELSFHVGNHDKETTKTVTVSNEFTSRPFRIGTVHDLLRVTDYVPDFIVVLTGDNADLAQQQEQPSNMHALFERCKKAIIVAGSGADYVAKKTFAPDEIVQVDKTTRQEEQQQLLACSFVLRPMSASPWQETRAVFQNHSYDVGDNGLKLRPPTPVRDVFI